MFKKKYLPLLLIIVISILVRFYKIGIIPYGYNWDETSITYNAWGIAEWHRDEWAELMPLAFKSFGDYKAPLLFYMLAVPFMAFGVIQPLIRIYSAIAGVIVVISTYFISKELFKKIKYFPELSTLLVAISPWAINFSRVGFEANIGLAIISLAILTFLKGLKNTKLWYLSAFFFALSIFAYHSTKIFVPIFLLFALIIYLKKIKTNPKPAIISTILFFIFVSPIIYVTFFGGGFERGFTTIFFDSQHNIRSIIEIVSEFLLNIKNQLSPSFLIGGIDDVGLRHLTPGFGIFYTVELPFFIYGLIRLLKLKSKSSKLLSLWLLAGILPAIISHQTPHAIRTLLIVPAIQIITAYGFINFLTHIKKHSIAKTTAIIIPAILITISFISYISTYYSTYATDSALDFQYGYEEALKIAAQRGRTKDKIVVTDTYGQPYVYVLLHNKISPEQFLAGALANYEFHHVDWPLYKPNSVIVGTPEEIPPEDAAVKDLVKIPGTEEIVFVIAETPK